MRPKKTLHFSLLTLLSFILIVGCSVVKTETSNSKSKQGALGYYLPESLLKITSTVSIAISYNPAHAMTTHITSEKFSVATELIADTKHYLTIKYTANPAASDILKLQVSEKGLLETINATTEDRTSDIISQLANAPQGILGGSSNKGSESKVVIKEFTAEFDIKAADIAAGVMNINWQIPIPNEEDPTLNPIIANGGFSLNINGANDAQDISYNTANDVISILNTSAKATGFSKEGILSRTFRHVKLSIKPNDPILKNNILDIPISVIDLSKVINIPIKRTAFVKRINNVTLKDGIALSNEINKPSPVEGFVSIPINLAKAIVGIPGQIITFRIDNTKRETDLENAKSTYQQALVKNQTDLEKLRLELEKTIQSKSTDLFKAQLELQSSLLKDKLDLLNAIDSLQKQIDAMKKKS